MEPNARSLHGADQPPQLDASAQRRPLMVEILGPAASGKTSLVAILCSKDDGVGDGLGLGKDRYVLPALGTLGRFLPLWALRYRRDRWFDRREMRSITFLETWSRALDRQRPTRRWAVVFDHGPLYRLARLREFGPALTRSGSFRRWWHNSLNRWLGLLDVVVWLDAPDDVLLERVGERGHWYLSARDSNEDEKLQFLARYRRAFEGVFEREAADRPKILRYRTDQRSADEIADEVLHALGSAHSPVLPEERLHP